MKDKETSNVRAILLHGVTFIVVLTPASLIEVAKHDAVHSTLPEPPAPIEEVH